VADTNVSAAINPSNLYVSIVTGLLLEENVFDYGGWHPTVGGQLGGTGTFYGAAANKFDHNVYLQGNSDGNKIVTRGNVFSRGASHGIQQRPGGYMLDNHAVGNAIGIFCSGDPAVLNISEVHNNVVQLGYSMAKGVGWETATTTSAVWGIEIGPNVRSMTNMQSTVIALRHPDDTEVFARSYDALSGDDEVSDVNTVLYHWNALDQGDGLGLTDPTRTIGTYYQKLVTDGDLTGLEPGTDDMDKMLGVMKSRKAGEWNSKFSAYTLNDYIRVGYDVPKFTN
jgi:hypothetical protein